VPIQSDLAHLTRLIERTLSLKKARPRAATADEAKATLESIRAGDKSRWTEPDDAAGPLEKLRTTFGLGRREAEILLVAVAPELDSRFRRIYGLLHDNLTVDRPTVGMAVELLYPPAERARARALFAAEAPLRFFRLIVAAGAPSDPLWQKEFVAPERVVRAAAGEGGIDDALAGAARMARPGVPLADVKVAAATKDRALQLLELGGAREPATPATKAVRPAVALRGPRRSGRKHLARALCTALGRPLLVVNLLGLPKDPVELGRLMRTACRDALLAGAALYLDDADEHADAEGPVILPRPLAQALARFPDVLFLGSQKRIEALDLLERDVLRVTTELPTPEERTAMWKAALPPDVKLAPEADIAELSRKYSLGAGAISAGARDAANAARLRGEPAEVRFNDLLEGARMQLQHKLGTLADRITKTYDWPDLILPEDVVEVLQEMVTFAKFRQKVYEDWGFGNKHSYGRGLSALFSGPPGTGKTMVAGIMARELDMELFRIDLSRVVSKWIGETEKNLGKVFDEAALSHAIILFDEADSLFAKRTEVKSSVDRYANLEVNYLLQRMEAYEGVSILTTNYDENLDEAFKRRLNFRVEFPFPDIEARERLWPIMLPKQVRTDGVIDWKHMAKRFELSGGNIRNAVLRAAFYAAEGTRAIDQEMLEKAATREADEMGKLVHHAPVKRR
jgi:ATPase family associated with various cellular activities (AAA)/Winged helix domain, variant